MSESGLDHQPATKKDVRDATGSLGWGILGVFVFVGFVGGITIWGVNGNVDEVRYAVETIQAILQTPTPQP